MNALINEYKEVSSGTHYRVGTPDGVITALEHARINRFRIAVVYEGDSVPEYGRVGRSCGPQLKVPILLHNTRSSGGTPICTTIVREIRAAAGGRIIYQADA